MKSPQKAEASNPYAVAVSTHFLELSAGRRGAVYNAMVERGNNAVQLLDAEAHLLYSSVSTYNVLGRLPETLTGADWRQYIHADDLAAFNDTWASVVAHAGESVGVQYRVRHQNGSWVWLEMEAVNRLGVADVEAVICNFRDITKRKSIENELRESESRWRFMAESMPVLMFTVAVTGQMEYCNPQWEAYAGVSTEEFVRDRRVQNDVIHPDDQAQFWKTWRASFRKGRPIEYQYRLRRKDGEYRWHICRIAPMKGPAGAVRLWVGSCTDIDDLQRAMTRRHELEMQAKSLEMQRRELLAINQSKDEFISLASHQLRTPATGVKQYLGMLLQGFAGSFNNDQQAFLQTAYESNERQIGIVNDLLQVALVDAGKIKLSRRKANIVSLVKSVVSEHTGEITGRSQQLVLKVADTKVTASVDAGRISVVLDNILDNASKYTPSDKTITVTVSKDERTNMVTIAVTDQGIGMSAAEAGKLFNKFSRLESPLTKSVDGSGLGLYWAKKIAELHGGTIKVKSRQGRGTTFTISLPL